ncbi:hypothetical protein [Pseudorhodoplanes sp.]|uniref:hypothetical protein n=1 Tax=Pseudorhodoplanes sp. TaxID=1934341 RepID=UPI003D152B90
MRKRTRKQDSAPPAPRLPVLPSARTDAEHAELAAYAEHKRTRPHPPRFQSAHSDTPTGFEGVSPARGIDADLFRARLARAFGAIDERAITHLLSQAAFAVEGHDRDAVELCNVAGALLAGIQPRNEMEGMLAVQMFAAHNLALSMARRALNTNRLDCVATYGSLSAKLMNVYTRQLEALARLRGQAGQQTVHVGTVAVEAGGQAVVGNVTTRKMGDGTRS